jgi:hypothetical protein
MQLVENALKVWRGVCVADGECIDIAEVDTDADVCLVALGVLLRSTDETA